MNRRNDVRLSVVANCGKVSICGKLMEDQGCLGRFVTSLAAVPSLGW